MSEIPHVKEGKNFVDDRGVLTYFNGIDLSIWKRFYLVKNHRQGYVRAWHGHQKEAKLIIPIAGSSLIGTVQITDWEKPSRDSKVITFVASADQPNPIFIPEGYANGFKTLTDDGTLLILSSSTLAQSAKDDFRYPWDYWNCWEEDFR